VLQCSRPPGISIVEVPMWILNQTIVLSTADEQKYRVVEEFLQLTVLDLQYEDAGHYSCVFSHGNTSAGSIEIIGISVIATWSCSCLLLEYAWLLILIVWNKE